MKIISPSEQVGVAAKRGSKFTGDVYNYLATSEPDGPVINTVTFTPGARTYWHTHEHGQILQGVAGRGLICIEGEQPRTLRAGDWVWAPPGERHWHGAAPDSFFTHIAISLGSTHWSEAVADEYYVREVFR